MARATQTVLVATSALLFCMLVAGQKGKDGYTDENRPYEFGFTIEGQQHRHEKKDEAGIIMGEFGFITADGIYHVTVYATDENGDFKILSMKNIRVAPSPYAGGSPGFKTTPRPVSATKSPTYQPVQQTTRTSAYGQPQQGLAGPPYQQTTRAPAFNQPRYQPGPTNSPLQESTTILAATTKKVNGKNGCGSCVIPTTTPPPPAPSQGPSFQNPFDRRADTGNLKRPSINPSSGFNAPKSNSEQPFSGGKPAIDPGRTYDRPTSNIHPSISNGNSQSFGTPGGSFVQNPGPPVTKIPGQLQPPYTPGQAPDYSGRQPPSNTGTYPRPSSQFGPSGNDPGSRIPNDVVPTGRTPSGPSIFGQTPIDRVSPGGPLFSQIPSGQNPPGRLPGQHSFAQTYDQNPGGKIPDRPAPEQTPFGQTPKQIPLDRTPGHIVSNPAQSPFGQTPEQIPFGQPHGQTPSGRAPGQIPSGQVSGQARYPSPPIGVERPGLPPGVTMAEIMALLYRFNYTVGFHGHHESGYRNGDKTGGYFVNGRDGIGRSVNYIANEFGYQPNISLVDLGLQSPDTPKEDTEKEAGLKGYEFRWFPQS